jgi:prevent-host-death family protein
MTSLRKGEAPSARAGGRKASKFLAASKARTGFAKSSKSPAGSVPPSTVRSNAVTAKPRRPEKARAWSLQDAKARFSELVRRVKVDGAQHVTVHGREEVVVISADEFRRLTAERTGAALIEVMQASPSRDVDLTPARVAMPVRTVVL